MGMLQEAGINCHLQDEYTITIDPLLNYAVGGMKLMVYELKDLLRRSANPLKVVMQTARQSGRHPAFCKS
jgi:hypothetical protein